MEAPVTQRTWKRRAASSCVLTLGLAAASLSGAGAPAGGAARRPASAASATSQSITLPAKPPSPTPRPGAILPPPPPTPAKPKPREPIQLGPACVTAECHPSIAAGKFTHGPVNLRQCEPCHVPVNKQHDFSKDPKGRELCVLCHDVEKPKKVVHKPFSLDCAQCHSPHGGDNRYFIQGGTGVEGCNRCHKDVRADLKFLHGPVTQGDCLACHSPHQSDHAKLLVDPPETQCVACHVDFLDKMKGAISVHEPAQKNCAGCHFPHGGATKSFVRAEGEKLCGICHQEFLAKTKKFKYPHMPMAEGKTCENCHQPHSSMQKKLLAQNVSDLCISCHSKAVETKTRVLSDIGAQINNSKYQHGPLGQKNCVACHEGHGSDFPSILNKAFPDKFYTPFTDKAYDLCFECHDKKIVLKQRSTDTAFRNGDLNLHYLHVNNEKGRSCRACHHEHASNQPKHIREQVPFGRWLMRITFTKTNTGGGCATGCHEEYKYDREHSVTNKTEKRS